MDDRNLYAVVMAGGRGERFWPLGRRRRPKQLLPLLGKRSMLEDTVQRLFPLFSPERILIVTSADYVDEARKRLPIPPENVVGEPVGRDTAPCVALAAGIVRARGGEDAVMALLPSNRPVPASVSASVTVTCSSFSQLANTPLPNLTTFFWTLTRVTAVPENALSPMATTGYSLSSPPTFRVSFSGTVTPVSLPMYFVSVALPSPS
ncbi:MAG: NTP transferase domain-containing protein, partial [Lentisphaeria bacterium]|nr:NTP transferase domain-containing protein [Lentisphaeria bacterium]